MLMKQVSKFFLLLVLTGVGSNAVAHMDGPGAHGVLVGLAHTHTESWLTGALVGAAVLLPVALLIAYMLGSRLRRRKLSGNR